MPEKDSTKVVYDGQCPFCANYVELMGLRNMEGVELIDARSNAPEVSQLKQASVDLDEGMVVIAGGQVHHAGEAMRRLSAIAGNKGLFARLFGLLFRNAQVARTVYPVLRFGRQVTLRMLGRGPIKDFGE